MAQRRIIWLALTAAALGCSSGGVTDTDTVNGVKYTARYITTIIGGQVYVSIIATLQNVSSSPQDRTYLAACQVRIRLYRPADGFKPYDEARLPCSSDVEATVSIPVGESRELQSGLRSTNTILGDSLAFQTYTLRGLLQTEGPNSEIEVVAGAWTPQAPPGVGAQRANQ